ncbi:T9SS type A sorting domain-containing protein [Marivirga sericea]|nr:T9SS type A sorting domain-containing protein [Marivirga sericea]
MRKLILLPFLTFLLALPAFSQDLIIESMTVEASYHMHSAFTYSATVKNIGVIPSNPGSLKIYFGIDANDYSNYVSQISIPALSADETLTLVAEIGGTEYVTDMDEAIGTYFVNTLIDPNAYNFFDVDPSNNKYQAGTTEVIASTADIILSDFSLDQNANLVQGGELSMTIDAANPGSTIRGMYIKAYLSEDEVFDENDLELESSDYLRFDYQSAVTGAVLDNFEIPFNLTASEYHIFLQIDCFDIIEEVDEANNIYQAGTVQIANSDAILSINEATIDYYWTDSGVDISFEITNTGSTDVSHYQYYVSSYSGGDGYNPPNYGTIGAGETWWEFVYLNNYEISGSYIYIGNNDPKYPYISEVEVYIGNEPTFNYNFNIADVYHSSPVETEDSEIPITVEIENPNNNSIYESATIDITLESLDGQIVENYSINEYVSMYDYGTDELNLSLPNRSSLIAGTYNVTTDITLTYESGGAGPFSSELEIIGSEFNIDVEVLGQNGDIINQGVVYFYEKTTEGGISFLSSAEIAELDGVGKVSFLQSAGNYMFYVVPDKDEFPNYIRTVSGNTFKLEETSFTEINSNATIQIETIYVDSNALNGSKIIEGNVVSGTATGRMTYSQTARASFDQTPVYLIQDNSVVAFTTTNASGAFSFSNLENGDYDVYFDDGDILESNDITANVNIDETTDIVNLTIDESGEVGIEDLKMEINAFFIGTKDVEADENHVSVEYGLSNSYLHNSIDIQDAFFYCYIKQNDVVLDSIAFERDLVIQQYDSLQFQNSLQLTNPLNIGTYEVELHLSTPYQNTKVRGSERFFDVIEPHYDVTIRAFDSQQLALASGIVQLYKVDESGQLVLFEEKAVAQDGVAIFNTPTCDYIVNVVPDKVDFPNLLSSFQNQKYYYSDADIQTLVTDTEHQVNVVSNPAQNLNGNRKVVFDLIDDNFRFDQTLVVLANAADSSVINTATMEENHVEIENLETGEYLFYLDDGSITMNHEKWYSLVINEQDDLYQIEIGSNTAVNQYDLDFVVSKDSVFNNYNNIGQLDMAFAIDKQSESFPDELLSVDFRIDLISNEGSDSLAFLYSEMLDFNVFENLSKTFLFDSFLDAGTYDVKVNYASQYTDGFVEGGAFTIDILDAGVNLTKVQIGQELLENASQIPLELHLNGSTDSLADFTVYYEHQLIKGTDTITIETHQKSIEIGNEESKTYSYAVDLENPLALGDYRLVTIFSPHHNAKNNQQLVETTFRIKNERLTLSNLKLSEELSIISGSMDFSFNINANSEDSIKNQNTKLFGYLIYKNDTLVHTEEDLSLNIPQSSTAAFQNSIDFDDHFSSGLNPGDYKFIIELKHPEDIYSEKAVTTFRIRDLSIKLLEVVIPEEVSGNEDQIDCEIKVYGNSNDIVRSLETSFKIAIFSKDEIVADTVFTKFLTIQRSGFINLKMPLSFLTELQDGDYVLELSYITNYMSNYSDVISQEFAVSTESEITSNRDKLISEYSIYPNPFVDHLQIAGDDFDAVFLYDQYGKLIKTYNEEKGFENLGYLNAGVYLLVIKYKGSVIHKKLVKK